MKKPKKSRLLVEVSNSFVRNVRLKTVIFIFKEKKCVSLICPSIYPYREREREVLGKICKNVCVYACKCIFVNTHQECQENTLTLVVGVISHTGAAR